MSNINGSTPDNSIVQGDNIGIGLTTDGEGNAIVLLWVEYENIPYGVALTEDSALTLAQSLIRMASEITKLEDGTNITPEELDEKMRQIIQGRVEPQD